MQAAIELDVGLCTPTAGAAAVAGDTGAGDEAHAKAAIESLGLVADVDGLDVEW